MGSARQDVQRLFGHFGLDPADYLVSPAEAPSNLTKVGAAGVNSAADSSSTEDSELAQNRIFEAGS